MPRTSDRAASPPVMEIAVEPKDASARTTLHAILGDLSREDAALAVQTDRESGQIVLGGRSEEHLDRLVDRLRDEFGIGLRIGTPQVAYRETIGRTCETDYTHKKMFGGKRAFARVKLRLAPSAAGSGAVVVTKLEEAGFQEAFLIGAERGVRTVLAAGPLAGFPVTDLAVTILDGAWHDEDSSEQSFEIAARAGMREGLTKAGPLLLEPIMDLRVSIPTICLDAVLNDLRQRRGTIDFREAEGDLSTIQAHAPVATLFGYRSSLGAITRGRNAFKMWFRDYAPVPRREPPDDRFPPAMAMRA